MASRSLGTLSCMNKYSGVSGIYAITHMDSGRKYIGSAVNISKRWGEHIRQLKKNIHHSKFMQRSWDKHGHRSFSFDALLFCEKSNLIFYEQTFLDAYQPAFNSAPTAGSQLGYKHSKETRKKLSAAVKRTRNFTGKSHSEESKEKISRAKKGVKNGPLSDETKAKIGEAHRGRVRSEEYRKKISDGLKGHKQGPEQIERRARKLRGRKMSEEFKRNASERMTGVKIPELVKEKIMRAKSVWPDDTVTEVRRLLAKGLKHKEVFAITGVPTYTVADISCGRKYRLVRS